MEKTIIIVGTHCAACKTLIEDVCREVAGVNFCLVDYQTGKTVINYVEPVDWSQFKSKVEALGKYQVNL